MVRPIYRDGTCGHGGTQRPWVWLWLTLLMLYSGVGLAATIEVSLDRNPVPLDESFTLIFSADAAPDDDPDFSILDKDFDVLGQSQSNQFSLNNGRSSRRIEWQVNVMAKHAGTLEIPPVPFGKDHSDPFRVTVTQGPAKHSRNDEVFIEVEADPKNPYVQAQVIYTVRVLSRIAFGEARLSTPEAADTLVEKLGDGQAPSSIALRNGVQYKMTEIRYALFPQKSGPLRIEPMRLEMQVTGGGRSMFNSFFNQQTRTQRVNSEALTLDVRPVPLEFKGKQWLPAEYVEIEDSWAKTLPKTMAGEPITRTLTIKAQGTTVGLLPELSAKAAPDTDAIKQYPDQPSQSEGKPLSGLSSLRQEKTALIISRAGNYRTPALEIPWWNIRTDRLEIARIPARELNVQASPVYLPTNEISQGVADTTTAKPAITHPAGNQPLQPMSQAGSGQPTSQTSDYWFWLAMIFGLGWFITGIAWWWFTRRGNILKEEIPIMQAQAVSGRDSLSAIRDACANNDPQAAYKALSDWDSKYRPAASNPFSSDGSLARETRLLLSSLYGKQLSHWEGQGLWEAYSRYIGDGIVKQNTIKNINNPLPPINKLDA